MRRPRTLVLVLVAWTAFVWVTRIRNVLGDDDLGTGATAAGLALSGSFLVLAAVAAWAVLTGRAWRRAAVRALAGWTVGAWLVRGTAIATGDHGVAFVVVHLVLAAVSIGLAVAADRAMARAAAGSPAPVRGR